MNHYEELGVSRGATTAEIRQAYKTLVRVLHPDQQQDENLRRLSELQLVRLNHMLQILSDPAQRRSYDMSLDRFLPVPKSPEPLQKVSLSDIRSVRLRLRLRLPPGLLVWTLIGAIALGSAIFWLRAPEPVYSQPVRQRSQRSSSTTETQPRQEVTAASGDQSKPPETDSHVLGDASDGPSRAPREGRQAKQDWAKTDSTARSGKDARRSNDAKLSPAKNESGGSSNFEGRQVAAVGPQIPPEAPKAQEPAPSPAPSQEPAASVAGKWLYVPQTNEGKNSLYPPEYIELRINSRAGLLRGKYHGKYRVADRAISSEINFQFEGRQGDTVSILPWSSTNGSKGELRLKRLTDESIEVNWITTSFGKGNTLASGVAVLYRSDPP